MRTPSHRRPRRRSRCVPSGTDLKSLAERATYVGSGEHESYPSAAGPPVLRSDASRCDPVLHGDFEMLTAWLRDAIVGGQTGAPWEGEFPRYAWIERDEVWYEARLVNRAAGTYKGYPLLAAERPDLS